MRIQIDTFQKQITLLESVNLAELYNSLESMLPEGTWREFTLNVNNQINWVNPIIVERYPQPTNPYWQPPWITTFNVDTTNNTSVQSQSPSIIPGVYNIELNG